MARVVTDRHSGNRFCRTLDNNAVPNISRYTEIVPWYDCVMPFLRVRSQRVDATVHGVAVQTPVVSRVVRLEMMPLTPHMFSAQFTYIEIWIDRIFAKNIITIGFLVIFDVYKQLFNN